MIALNYTEFTNFVLVAQDLNKAYGLNLFRSRRPVSIQGVI